MKKILNTGKKTIEHVVTINTLIPIIEYLINILSHKPFHVIFIFNLFSNVVESNLFIINFVKVSLQMHEV